MMLEYHIWGLSALALYGAYLNSKGDVRGFLIWMITNAGFIIHNLTILQYAQASLFAAYFFIAIYGYCKWQKKSIV